MAAKSTPVCAHAMEGSSKNVQIAEQHRSQAQSLQTNEANENLVANSESVCKSLKKS
jgi:hypothetical protein